MQPGRKDRREDEQQMQAGREMDPEILARLEQAKIKSEADKNGHSMLRLWLTGRLLS